MRALVLSGGGAKGAYQAGAINYFMGTMRYQYDLFAGISVGALNSGYLSQFRNQQKAAASLCNMWLNTETKDVHKPWFWGKLAALWKPSLRNSQPLVDMVYEHIDRNDIIRQLRIGAVDLRTGEYHVWSEKSPMIMEAILASASFPAMLTPVEIDDGLYTDGGARVVTPIKDAIEAGATHIDVIMCSPKGLLPDFDEKPNTIDVAMRSIAAMSDEIVQKDLKLAHLYNQLAKKNMTHKRFVEIRVLRPAKPLGASLEFTRDRINYEIDLGYSDAKKRGLTPLRNLI